MEPPCDDPKCQTCYPADPMTTATAEMFLRRAEAAEAEAERLREATTELAAAIRADEHGFGLRVAHALGDVDRALATKEA